MDEIDALFDRVWEMLELPAPRPPLAHAPDAEQAGREALRRRRARPLHRPGGGAFGRWVRWELWRRAHPFDPRARPEIGERLHRRIEFERAADAGAYPRITDAAGAMRGLRLLDRIEALCRETNRKPALAVCLALQRVLFAGSLGRPDAAGRVSEELARILEGDDSETRSARTALERFEEFLRDPFRESDSPWLRHDRRRWGRDRRP